MNQRASTPRADAHARMWSAREIAARWGCSLRTVQREMAAGRLPSVSLGPGGRLKRVPDADLVVSLDVV